MSKFNGLLLVSDFDNTLVYTEEALQKCVDMPPVSDENRAAIEYFMANGGTFSVATGRAKPAFETVVDGIPMNGPTVLFNGAAIYDFSRREYLVTAFLPDDVRPRIEEVVTCHRIMRPAYRAVVKRVHYAPIEERTARLDFNPRTPDDDTDQ